MQDSSHGLVAAVVSVVQSPFSMCTMHAARVLLHMAKLSHIKVCSVHALLLCIFDRPQGLYVRHVRALSGSHLQSQEPGTNEDWQCIKLCM